MLYLLVGGLAACQDSRVELVRTSPLKIALEHAGWKATASQIDPGLTLDVWMRQQAERKLGVVGDVTWQSSPAGVHTMISATASLENMHVIRHLLFDEKTGRVSLLDMDVAAAYMASMDIVLDDPPQLVPVSKETMLDRMSNADARFVWQGCFTHTGQHPIDSIWLRAVLLAENEADAREAYQGKARHHTKRSGIPSSLQPGESFCTTLTSSRIAKASVDSEHGTYYGAVEGCYEDRNAGVVCGLLKLVTLDAAVYAGRKMDHFAVVKGGALKISKTDHIDLPHPALVTVLYQQGNRYQIKTIDGIEGEIKRQRMIGLYPRKLSQTREQLTEFRNVLKEIATAGLSGDDKTVAAMQLAGKALAMPDVQQELLRRFGTIAWQQGDVVTVHLLAAEKHDGYFQLEYYYWLHRGKQRVAQGYDVLRVVYVNDGTAVWKVLLK